MDLSDWFRNKSFTSDWSSNHFDTWAEHLAKFRGHAVNVLEIGSWEGRSAIFFWSPFPRARSLALTLSRAAMGSTSKRLLALKLALTQT